MIGRCSQASYIEVGFGSPGRRGTGPVRLCWPEGAPSDYDRPHMQQHQLKGVAKFCAVVAAVLLASALLAPPLHAVLPYSFARIFIRLLMVNAIIAVAIFVRFRRELFVRFGMRWTRESAGFLWTGFLTGFAGLVAFAVVSVAAGHADVVIRQLPAFRWAERIAEGLATGILIGVLEEFLFRGFIFTSMRDAVTRGRVLPAMVVTSLLYALLHFIHVRQPAISPDPGFADSLALILAPFQSLADWPTAWPAAVGLFLFGMVLNQALVQSASLYPSIGLHTGCVTFLRVVGLFVKFGQDDVLLWSSQRVYDGAMGWAFLLLIGLVLTVRLRRAAP